MPELQAHIRSAAQDTERVLITSHAKQQMALRKVIIAEVYECLREGLIALPPEEDIKTGHLVCRMARYVCGRNVAVCVALDDDDPSLVVVTVFVVTPRS